MKKKNLLQLGIILFLAQIMFACSSAEYYRFAPTKEKAYQSLKAKPAPESQATIPKPENTAPKNQLVLTPAPKEPVLEASVAKTPLVTSQPQAVKPLFPVEKLTSRKTELNPEEARALVLVRERLAHLTKSEKKELKTGLKNVLQEKASDTNIVEIIFAILIPPVGVFLHEGITNRFWISLLLTILFFVPGVIYALLVVTDTI